MLSIAAIFLTPALSLAAKAKISWSASDPKPAGYWIYKRTSGESYNYKKPVWTGSKTTATINNLKDNTQYYFGAVNLDRIDIDPIGNLSNGSNQKACSFLAASWKWPRVSNSHPVRTTAACIPSTRARVGWPLNLNYRGFKKKMDRRLGRWLKDILARPMHRML